MPSLKGIGSRNKSGPGNNQVRKLTTPCDNPCFNRNSSHSNRNELSLPVISGPISLNNSIINPSQMSSVRQHPSSSSNFTSRDNWCFDSKESNSKINELPSLVIPVPPPLNDSFINPPQMYYVSQQSYSSSHNTTHVLQSPSITGRTSPDL